MGFREIVYKTCLTKTHAFELILQLKLCKLCTKLVKNIILRILKACLEIFSFKLMFKNKHWYSFCHSQLEIQLLSSRNFSFFFLVLNKGINIPYKSSYTQKISRKHQEIPKLAFLHLVASIVSPKYSFKPWACRAHI